MLGNKLYGAVKKGYIPLSHIRQLFYQSWRDPGVAFQDYKDLSERLARLRSRKGANALEPRGERPSKSAQG
jgi:hypothetical protein